jgi:hypothetical protein
MEAPLPGITTHMNRRGTRHWALAVGLLGVALALAGCAGAGTVTGDGTGAGAGAGNGTGTAGIAGSPATASGSVAPLASAPLTLLSGRRTTLRAFSGEPVMVWFVAAGCGACSASLPVVARHLRTFTAAKVQILVLGIYGAFAQGPEGRTQLVRFGRGAAGQRFADPAWTWALASAQLTSRLDPAAIPDEYFLINRSGHTVYQGSTPVSTLGPLLSHVKEL